MNPPQEETFVWAIESDERCSIDLKICVENVFKMQQKLSRF